MNIKLPIILICSAVLFGKVYADVSGDEEIRTFLTNDAKVCSKSIKGNTIELFLVGGNTLYVREEAVIPKAIDGLNFSSSYKISNSKGGVVGLVRKPIQIYSNKKYTQTGFIDTTVTKFEIHDRSFGEIIFTVDIEFIDDSVITKEKITCKFKATNESNVNP